MSKRLFIDVREPREYESGHVDGAINMPPLMIMTGAKKLNDIPKDTEIILYCVSGSRSNVSMGYLRDLGFTNLTNGINMQHVNAKYSK